MLSRNPLLVFVSIPGLAIGLSAVLLLSVYLNHELSYDKHFPTKDNVLRLYNTVFENNQKTTYGICLRKAYTEIPQRVPEIEAATQIYRGWSVTAEYQKKKYPSLNMLYVDNGFFDVFGLELLHGDKKDALLGKNNAVITASTAQKIFGSTDCLGAVLEVSEEAFSITGIIKDLPPNTHFKSDLLISMETINPEGWGGLELYSYFRINDKANLKKVGEKIAKENNALMKPWGEPFNLTVESGTEKLADLHLHSVVDFDLSPKANLTQIYIIAGIAFFVLLIALVNFINLYILHGEKRLSEIAARKVIGASRTNLTKIFYSETGIIGLLALVLALVITFFAQPYFDGLMKREIGFGEIYSSSGIAIISGILVVLVLVSGAYPSYYLSKFNLVNALKGKSNNIKRKSSLSRIAVVLQFTVSVFLITSLIIIFAQVNFLKQVPLGFNPENVVGIRNLNHQIKQSIPSITHELKQLAYVESVGSSTHEMGSGASGQGIKKYGDPGNLKSIDEYRVNPGFAKTMQLQIIEGRYFNKSEADKKAVILNESAAKMLALDKQEGSLVDMHGTPLKVIAIVEDFYYIDHPGETIAPLVLTNYRTNTNNIYVRTKNPMTTEQQTQIEKIFKNYSPDFIYGQILLTDIYAHKYTNEERVMKLVTTGAILAICISFMGLMALSVMNVNRRKKEIGIRKVMGSTERQVVKALLTETFVLMAIAIGAAFIFSFMAMHQWLINFANHIYLSPLYFLLSATLTILIAVLAVGWQSWRAATRNPVEALKYE